MKQHPTTLKDLAQALGVSMATVSRALRNSHEVSDLMKQRVRQLAQEMNYKPNPFAQGLRNQQTHTIGVIVPNRVAHFFASVLDGIEEHGLQHGYFVISANSHEDYQREVQAVENFIALRVQGVIACLAQDTQQYAHYQRLIDMGIPVVFFSRTCLPDQASHVVADDVAAAFQATQHLIATGSRRIAFVGGPNHLDLVRRRKHGYLEALREAGMPIDRNLVLSGKIDFENACTDIRQLLQSNHRPDALLALNDILTYAAIDTLKSLHLRIPHDVAVIGFTDGDSATFVSPALSAIMDQAHVLGKRACELLMCHIKGDKRVYAEVIPMILKIRNSSDKHASPQP